MSEHHAAIAWSFVGSEFKKLQYSREHTWHFDGGAVVPASASPSVVPAPWSNPAGVDPEEAYVASVASCHMLWWVALAARRGFDVDSYHDDAVGRLEKDEQGRAWISTVTLHPTIRYGARAATPDEESQLHEQAHAQCFIANSIRTRVTLGRTSAGEG